MNMQASTVLIVIRRGAAIQFAGINYYFEQSKLRKTTRKSYPEIIFCGQDWVKKKRVCARVCACSHAPALEAIICQELL